MSTTVRRGETVTTRDVLILLLEDQIRRLELDPLEGRPDDPVTRAYGLGKLSAYEDARTWLEIAGPDSSSPVMVESLKKIRARRSQIGVLK